jgi:3-hydroxymyristoyl/3-hydroxydecanoyl-(acyl carrier protein) dehydratase
MAKRKASVVKMYGQVTVDGALVAEAEVMCKLAERPDKQPGDTPGA